MNRSIFAVVVCLTLSVFFPFSIQAQDVLKNCNPNGTTAMNIGDIVACAIDPVVDSDFFTFFGRDGETFMLTLTETAGGHYPAPYLELFDPNLDPLDDWYAQNTGVSRQFKLTKTGTYTVLVHEYGDDATVDYNLALQRIFPSPAGALTLSFDDPIEDETISPVSDSDIFLFGGAQNDFIMLTLTETAGGHYPAPYLELFDPNLDPVDDWYAQNTGVSRQFKLTKTGTYTVLVHEYGDDATVVYNLGLYCISGICPSLSPFLDVPPNHWAYDYIMAIYDEEITTGCSNNPTKYCPSDAVTRAQMAVFLERGINGSDYAPPGATGVFDDCPVNHWAADWVEQFYADGITSGCSTNPLMYCPDDIVTRAQMAVFLLRSMYGNGYTPPSAVGIFDDVPVTHWASDWIEQLYDEGITGGCSTDPPLYCPDDVVTRAEMAVFIVRAFDL